MTESTFIGERHRGPIPLPKPSEDASIAWELAAFAALRGSQIEARLRLAADLTLDAPAASPAAIQAAAHARDARLALPELAVALRAALHALQDLERGAVRLIRHAEGES